MNNHVRVIDIFNSKTETNRKPDFTAEVATVSVCVYSSVNKVNQTKQTNNL